MITSKSVYIARYAWGYITRYPHSTAEEVAGSQTQYSRAEIERALGELVQQGYIRYDSPKEIMTYGSYRGFVPLVPFVVEAPAWASRR